MKTRPLKIYLGTFLSALMIPSVLAGEFSARLGMYSLSAKTSKKTSGLSGFGSYQLAYDHSLTPSLNIRAGYSMLMTSGIGGDSSYGFDLGGIYFPFTKSHRGVWKTENAEIVHRPIWMPYAGAGFHQRNFQSTDSSYSGMGLVLGTKRALENDFELILEFRYLMLAGPKASTLNETDLMGGISFPF